MSLTSYKGRFITFEGGEGSGKTTLINSLYEALSQLGKKTIKTREPGGTPLGSLIRSLLLEKEEVFISPHAELLLFMADRANHVEEKILPALQKGGIVLCDRFSDSSLAYQGAYGLISRDEILSLIAFATKGLKPDLTIYLDIDPIIGIERAKRSSFDRMEQKQIAFHQRVRENFQTLARLEPNRFFKVDATKPAAEVFSLVYSHIQNRFL